MKKLLALILCCSACVSLTACKESDAINVDKLVPVTSATSPSSDESSADTTTSELTSSHDETSSVDETSDVSSKKATSTKKTSTTKNTSSKKPTSSNTSSKTPSSDPSSESEMTLSEYIENNRDVLEALENGVVEEANGEGSVKIFARGNSLVIRFTKVLPPETTPEYIELLQTSLKSTFDNIPAEEIEKMSDVLAQLKNEFPSAESIIIEFVTDSGIELGSKTFS